MIKLFYFLLDYFYKAWYNTIRKEERKYIKMKFKIYQIRDIENCPYAFGKYKEDRFTMDDYYEVYESNEYISTEEKSDIFSTLEEIFEIFNCNRPEKFKGHSLSVSDIVEILNDGDNNGLYYCENFGWKKVR